MKKITQKEIVKDFIKFHCENDGCIKTWEIERMGQMNNMMAGSSTRYARTLCNEGFIKHSDDRHTYILNQ